MSGYVTTPNLGLLKPDYNGADDQWGNYLNQNADTLDSALGPSGTLFLPLSPSPVTATGSTTSRSLQDRAAEVVNVRDFGAKGDGTTDDTAAINAAAAYARSLGNVGWTLDFPFGTYRVTAPLNFTSLNRYSYVGGTVQGNSSIIRAVMPSGGIAVDCTDSRWLRFHDLMILGDQTSPPSIGIQFGPLNVGTESADYNRMTGCAIQGFFSFAAYYNKNSENFLALGCYLNNGTGTAGSYVVVMDGINHWNASSSFVTITQPVESTQTFQGAVWIQCAFQGNGAKGVLWMAGITNHRYIGNYASSNITGASIVVIYQMITPIATAVACDFDIHMETTGSAHSFLMSGPASGQATALVSGFKFRDLTNFPSTSVFALDAGSSIVNAELRNAEIEVDNNAPLFDNPAVWTARFSSANIGHQQYQGNTAVFAGNITCHEYPGYVRVPEEMRLVATNGGALTVPRGGEWVNLLPAGPIASFGVTMPVNPLNGQTVQITTNQTISTLTIGVTAGQNVAYQPGTLYANASVAYRWDAPLGYWVGVGQTNPNGPRGGPYLPLSGGGLTGGLNFGSSVAPSNTDLSHHIALYGTNFGFSVSNSRLNYVASGANHVFVIGGADVMTIAPTGVQIDTGMALVLVTTVNAANDAAAGAAGVGVGQVYRNGSVLMIRVA